MVFYHLKTKVLLVWAQVYNHDSLRTTIQKLKDYLRIYQSFIYFFGMGNNFTIYILVDQVISPRDFPGIMIEGTACK